MALRCSRPASLNGHRTLVGAMPVTNLTRPDFQVALCFRLAPAVAMAYCSRIILAETSGAIGLMNQPEPSSNPAVLTMAGTISICQ